jgi:hypothetical protein
VPLLTECPLSSGEARLYLKSPLHGKFQVKGFSKYRRTPPDKNVHSVSNGTWEFPHRAQPTETLLVAGVTCTYQNKDVITWTVCHRAHLIVLCHTQ